MTTATAPRTLETRIASLRQEEADVQQQLRATAFLCEQATGAEYQRLARACNTLEAQAINATEERKRLERQPARQAVPA